MHLFLMSLAAAALFLGGCAEAPRYVGLRLPEDQRVVVEEYASDPVTSFFAGKERVAITALDDMRVIQRPGPMEMGAGPHVLSLSYSLSSTYTSQHSTQDCHVKFVASPGDHYRLAAFVDQKYWTPYLEDVNSGEISHIGGCGDNVLIIAAPRPQVPFQGRKLDKKLVVYMSMKLDSLEYFFRAAAINAFRKMFSSVEVWSYQPSSSADLVLLTIKLNDKNSTYEEGKPAVVPFEWRLTYGTRMLRSGEGVANLPNTLGALTDLRGIMEQIYEQIGGPVSDWAAKQTGQ